MSIIEVDPHCANDITSDPDISSSEQWEDYDGLTRQEGVAYSTGGVSFAAGQMLFIQSVVRNPDQETGLYKHVDLFIARPTQAGDVGPFAFAMQSSTEDGEQAAVLMQGHVRGDWSGIDQGETWAAGDVLYVAADGFLTTDFLNSLGVSVGQIINPAANNGSAMLWAGAAHPLFEGDLFDLDRMRWRGNWVNGQTYLTNDVSLDFPYLMIANSDTTDRPAPQAVGDPVWKYVGTSPASSILAKTLLVQNSYTLAAAVFLTGYRVFVTAGNQYSLFLRDEDTGQVDQLWSATPAQSGWINTATSGRLFGAGTHFTLGLYATEPDPSPVDYVLNYNYTTPNNVIAPGAGVMSHSSKALDSLRANKTDQNGDQWQGGAGPLAQMTPGDTITGAGMTWSVQAITEEATYIAFIVAPAQQGTAGVQDFTFETVTATPIDTVIDPDYYINDANVQPSYSVDGGSLQLSDDAYGIDVEWQLASVSDDWDFMASTEATGGSSDGGGGASTFIDLTDTPNAWPSPNTTRQGLERSVGSNVLAFIPGGHVKTTGDTMTGPLTVDPAATLESPYLDLYIPPDHDQTVIKPDGLKNWPWIFRTKSGWYGTFGGTSGNLHVNGEDEVASITVGNIDPTTGLQTLEGVSQFRLPAMIGDPDGGNYIPFAKVTSSLDPMPSQFQLGNATFPSQLLRGDWETDGVLSLAGHDANDLALGILGSGSSWITIGPDTTTNRYALIGYDWDEGNLRINVSTNVSGTGEIYTLPSDMATMSAFYQDRAIMRRMDTDARYLALSGGTMTGALSVKQSVRDLAFFERTDAEKRIGIHGGNGLDFIGFAPGSKATGSWVTSWSKALSYYEAAGYWVIGNSGDPSKKVMTQADHDAGLLMLKMQLEGAKLMNLDHTAFQNGTMAGTTQQWEYDRQQNIIDSIDAGVPLPTGLDPTADETLTKRRAEALAIQNYLVKTELASDHANDAVDTADAEWVENNPRPPAPVDEAEPGEPT